jgi:hypothetical protein
MTRWPLLLLAGHVDIAIALAPFLVVHRRQVTIAPFLAVELLSRRPSPSIRHRAVHRRPSPLCSQSIAAAIAPSIAVEEPSRAVPRHRGAVAPSLTIKEPSRRPSPSRSRRAVPRHRGAVAPSIAIEEPSRRTSPSRSRRPCRLTTPATRLAPPSLSSSGWLSRCLSSRRRLPSAGASHCGHRLSCLSSVRLVVPSPRFSRRHLPSASASASHRAVASSCHAHLGPLVRLVKASPLLTPPPPICGIIVSSQRSGLMLV